MLDNIFKDTAMHKYYMDMASKENMQKGREEERQARLQSQHQVLLTIVQARFPTLSSLAQAQAEQINDVAILEKVIASVGAAKTEKKARKALQNWQQGSSSDE